MRILHINSYYSVSKFYKNLYDEQVNRGLDIDVFVAISSNFNKRDFDYGGYTIISRNHNQLDRFLFHLKHKKILRDIMSKYVMEDYSVIHAHSLFSNGYIAMKLKEKYGKPYIVAVRNTDVNLFFSKMLHLRKLGIEILSKANTVVFLSEPYKKLVLDAYVPAKLQDSINQKSVIIPNGIDEFWFTNIGSPKQSPDGSILRLLQVGDVNKNKNIETTLKAIELLIKDGYKVKLDVVGRVNDQKLFNKIDEYEHANFHGYKSKEELIEIYRENDIFVLPSISETFGLVYAEAMSQGLPVIYTRGQGFDGHFEDGIVGYSVDCNDEKEIANSIKKVLSSYQSISKNCVDKSKSFNWNYINKKILFLYKNCN